MLQAAQAAATPRWTGTPHLLPLHRSRRAPTKHGETKPAAGEQQVCFEHVQTHAPADRLMEKLQNILAQDYEGAAEMLVDCMASGMRHSGKHPPEPTTQQIVVEC